jgi:hypothetical protein
VFESKRAEGGAYRWGISISSGTSTFAGHVAQGFGEHRGVISSQSNGLHDLGCTCRTMRRGLTFGDGQKAFLTSSVCPCSPTLPVNAVSKFDIQASVCLVGNLPSKRLYDVCCQERTKPSASSLLIRGICQVIFVRQRHLNRASKASLPTIAAVRSSSVIQ